MVPDIVFEINGTLREARTTQGIEKTSDKYREVEVQVGQFFALDYSCAFRAHPPTYTNLVRPMMTGLISVYLMISNVIQGVRNIKRLFSQIHFSPPSVPLIVWVSYRTPT